MKFLVDAQLPLRLAQQLAAIGHDAVHSSELADGNRTSDAALASFADDECRIVVTKDRDFEVGHLIGGILRVIRVHVDDGVRGVRVGQGDDESAVDWRCNERRLAGKDFRL